MGAKLSYLMKLKANYYLQFNLGIKNIFNAYQSALDRGKYRDAGFVYGPQLPRSVYFGIKISI
jgi:outer membrane receptor for ferrienterochelin and colicins